MAITDITNKIIEEARKRADILRADANTTAQHIAEETQEKKKKLEEVHQKNLAKAIEENKKKVELAAELEVKRKLDAQKRTLIDEVFALTAKELSSLSDRDYEEIIISLAQKLTEKSAQTLRVPEQRKETTENAVKKAGVTYAAVQTDPNITGGFILDGKNFSYNLSFEEIIANKKSELEILVAKLLFD